MRGCPFGCAAARRGAYGGGIRPTPGDRPHTRPGRQPPIRGMGGGLLVAEGLAAFRGERLVFSAIDFTVEPGGALLLTGPNGSGKSTLLRLVAGLVRAEAGRVS